MTNLSQILDFWHESFESTLRANKNWGRPSDIVAVMLPKIISWDIILENILSMKVFESLVILVGYNICEIKEFAKFICRLMIIVI